MIFEQTWTPKVIITKELSYTSRGENNFGSKDATNKSNYTIAITNEVDMDISVVFDTSPPFPLEISTNLINGISRRTKKTYGIIPTL